VLLFEQNIELGQIYNVQDLSGAISGTCVNAPAETFHKVGGNRWVAAGGDID
jgi:hypothetical protein